MVSIYLFSYILWRSCRLSCRRRPPQQGRHSSNHGTVLQPRYPLQVCEKHIRYYKYLLIPLQVVSACVPAQNMRSVRKLLAGWVFRHSSVVLIVALMERWLKDGAENSSVCPHPPIVIGFPWCVIPGGNSNALEIISLLPISSGWSSSSRARSQSSIFSTLSSFLTIL